MRPSAPRPQAQKIRQRDASPLPLSCVDVLHQVPLQAITACFAQPLLARLEHSVDLILFNPPYVPTEASEASIAQSMPGIQGSWAGGNDGMQVTDQFFPQVHVSNVTFSDVEAEQESEAPNIASPVP